MLGSWVGDNSARPQFALRILTFWNKFTKLKLPLMNYTLSWLPEKANASLNSFCLVVGSSIQEPVPSDLARNDVQKRSSFASGVRMATLCALKSMAPVPKLSVKTSVFRGWVVG